MNYLAMLVTEHNQIFLILAYRIRGRGNNYVLANFVAKLHSTGLLKYEC